MGKTIYGKKKGLAKGAHSVTKAKESISSKTKPSKAAIQSYLEDSQELESNENDSEIENSEATTSAGNETSNAVIDLGSDLDDDQDLNETRIPNPNAETEKRTKSPSLFQARKMNTKSNNVLAPMKKSKNLAIV